MIYYIPNWLYQPFFFKRPYLGNETRFCKRVSGKSKPTDGAFIPSFMKVTSPNSFILFRPLFWKRALFRGVPGGPKWAIMAHNMPLGPNDIPKKVSEVSRKNWVFPVKFCESTFSSSFSPPLPRCYMHLWFRWKAPQMTLEFFPWVYYMIICYVGSAWGHSGTQGGPKMAQNSTKKADNVSKSPEWLKMALHDAHFVTCDPGIKTFWYHHPFDAMYIQRI